MQTMNHRTTFALDGKTAKGLKRLAASWKVSQAEVVRRAVARAEETEYATAKPDPAALLRALQAKGQGLDPEQGRAYLREVRESRKKWRAS
jgi:hypothetical protein